MMLPSPSPPFPPVPIPFSPLPLPLPLLSIPRTPPICSYRRPPCLRLPQGRNPYLLQRSLGSPYTRSRAASLTRFAVLARGTRLARLPQ